MSELERLARRYGVKPKRFHLGKGEVKRLSENLIAEMDKKGNLILYVADDDPLKQIEFIAEIRGGTPRKGYKAKHALAIFIPRIIAETHGLKRLTKVRVILERRAKDREVTDELNKLAKEIGEKDKPKIASFCPHEDDEKYRLGKG